MEKKHTETITFEEFIGEITGGHGKEIIRQMKETEQKGLNITKSNNIITNDNNKSRDKHIKDTARKPGRIPYNKGPVKKSKDKLQAGARRGDENE
ncbi:MAG: hypothetical protein KJ955_05175 [Nanoarchaeota archaeon]|nr:hypothetical protein [Nanoarchaeota archaeon]